METFGTSRVLQSASVSKKQKNYTQYVYKQIKQVFHLWESSDALLLARGNFYVCQKCLSLVSVYSLSNSISEAINLSLHLFEISVP